MKRLDLCGRCAALMENGYKVKKVSGGVDNKVFCAHCGKRRYGGTFEFEPIKAQNKN